MWKLSSPNGTKESQAQKLHTTKTKSNKQGKNYKKITNQTITPATARQIRQHAATIYVTKVNITKNHLPVQSQLQLHQPRLFQQTNHRIAQKTGVEINNHTLPVCIRQDYQPILLQTGCKPHILINKRTQVYTIITPT